MKPVRFRAVVLAAGLGRRLRPLTEFLPKPLLPIAGEPAVAHTLSQLSRAGCEAAALNLHHLGDEIRGRFGGAFDGMPLTYSPEPELLGTLGALAPLEGFLAGTELVVVVNGDSHSRWPIKALIRRHRRCQAQATLLVSKRADAGEFAAIGVDLEGRLVSFRDGQALGEAARRQVFAGMHVFAPELVRGLPARPADFVDDLYLPLLERGSRLQTHEFSRPWHDLGTPRRYLAAARDAARRARGGRRRGRATWVAPGGFVNRSARVRRSVIERGARVEADADVDGSLVLPGGCIAAGCQVRESIVGFAAELPRKTIVDRRMVTVERADVQPGESDSVVGGLVYSRMR